MTEVCEIRRALKADEIDNVAWVGSEENPADALTRANYNKTLHKALRMGKLNYQTEQCISKGP